MDVTSEAHMQDLSMANDATSEGNLSPDQPLSSTVAITSADDETDLAAAIALKSMAAARHITLVGDSTLDNVVWLEESIQAYQCIAGLLRHDGFVVTNLAADGFTSDDVLHGALPNISRAVRARVQDPFPSPSASSPIETHRFHPLDFIKRSPTTSVVLSVGGNDIRHILGSMHTLPTVMKNLQTNYAAIVDRIHGQCPRLIIMLCYRPSQHHNVDGRFYGVYEAIGSVPGPGTAASKLNALMEVMFQPILDLARRLQLPVIDLPNSFDPHDGSLYECQIEPSAIGGARIASLINHIVTAHNFTGESLLYSLRTARGEQDITKKPNRGAPPQAWRVEF